MKSKLSLCILFNLIATSAFAINPCVQDIQSHIGTTWMEMTRCDLHDEDMPAINTFLESHQNIIRFQAINNYIADEGATILAKNPALKLVNLNGNQVGDKGAIAFGKYSHLTNLDLSHNHKITNEGAIALAQNTSLDLLDLRDNQIGDDGATALSNSHSISALWLANNIIGDIGASSIAQNKIVKLLALDYNQIGNAGAIDLANNHSLEVLYITYNHIGTTGLNALKNNKTLMELKTEGNQNSSFNSLIQ